MITDKAELEAQLSYMEKLHKECAKWNERCNTLSVFTWVGFIGWIIGLIIQWGIGYMTWAGIALEWGCIVINRFWALPHYRKAVNEFGHANEKVTGIPYTDI